MKRVIILSALLLSGPAIASEQTDLVRQFYAPVTSEMEPSMRENFTGDARARLDANDAMTEAGGEMGCIDFGLGIDAQDWDQEELDRTLELTEEASEMTTQVTARFTLFPGDASSGREIVWSLLNEGGAWRIEDISSVTNNWKLSEFDCN